MSYSYQPEQPRNSGSLYPGWPSTVQYTSYPMEREWSDSTGTSNQATWSPEAGERSYVLSPMTPTSGTNSPGYYSGDTQTAATATGNSEGDWSLYYNFIVPEDQRKEAYWELQSGYQPSDTLPERRPVEKQKKSGREVYPCLFEGCTTTKPFKRTADLARHYSQLHAEPDQAPKFHCDYVRCSRHKEGLGRKDHYRDHLRDFHGEDLSKRVKDSGGSRGKGKSGKGGSGHGGKDGGSGSSRVNVSEKWWRCTRCLERKQVADGWYCTVCKRPCEEERIANRTRKSSSSKRSNSYHDDSTEVIKTESFSPVSNSISSTSQSPGNINMNCTYQCNNTWIYSNLTDSWDPCPNCGIASQQQDANDGIGTDTYTATSSSDTYYIPATSTSNWQQSTDSYSNHETTTSASNIQIKQYKTNCGSCSDYMVWNGSGYVPCLLCTPQMVAPQVIESSVRSDGRRGRHGGSSSMEKEKKKDRRRSGWFG